MFLKHVACENWNPLCFVFGNCTFANQFNAWNLSSPALFLFLHLEAERLLSLKIWSCEWGQSLTCSAWFVYWFIFLRSVAASSVSTADSRRSPLSNSGGVTWCTSWGFQMVHTCFSPSHMASHTENNLHVCLQNLSLGESVWNNYSFLCKCFYQGQFL